MIRFISTVLFAVLLQCGITHAQWENQPFIQEGTGAVARTISERLRDTANVRDFGAKCDSRTDDTSAIQKALDAARQIAFPRGGVTCNISSTVFIRHTNQLVEGNNAVLVYTGSDSAVDSQLQGQTYPQRISVRDLVIVAREAGATGFTVRNAYSYFINVWVQLHAANQTAWRLAESHAGRGTHVYESTWISPFVIGNSSSNQTGWSFSQTAEQQLGPNDNMIIGGRTTRCSLGMLIRGAGNYVHHGIEGVPTGGKAVFVSNLLNQTGQGANSNELHLYLEGAAGAQGVVVDTYAMATKVNFRFATGFSPPGVNLLVDNSINKTTVNLTAQQGVITSPASGFMAPTNVNLSYKVNRGVVTINVPAFTGTSNSTSKTLTGIPPLIRPATAKNGAIAIQNNGGAYVWGTWSMSTTGVVTFYTTPNNDLWANSGTASVKAGTIQYTLD